MTSPALFLVGCLLLGSALASPAVNAEEECEGLDPAPQNILCYLSDLTVTLSLATTPPKVDVCRCTHLVVPLGSSSLILNDGNFTLDEAMAELLRESGTRSGGRLRRILSLAVQNEEIDELSPDGIISSIDGLIDDGLIDGIEINWQQPDTGDHSKKNRANIVHLVKEIHAAFQEKVIVTASSHANSTETEDEEEEMIDAIRPLILLRLPTVPEKLVKGFDLKPLTKTVDLFVVSTHNMSDATQSNVTYHHSRLMGLSDIYNTDSVLDLVVSLGVPASSIVAAVPTFALQFKLSDDQQTTPGSMSLEGPKSISSEEVCALMKDGNWTVERDDDLTGTYAYSTTGDWIAFDDQLAAQIKAKYFLLREIAGVALMTIDMDSASQCGFDEKEGHQPTTRTYYNNFFFLESDERTKRHLVESLQEDLLTSAATLSIPVYPSDRVHVSPYRVVRLVDRSGKTTVVRQAQETSLRCSRQGYYRHPEDCSRFYRCVKFDQYTDDFTVFEYDCPDGLVFDEKWEVCTWPSQAAACTGSSEIQPVPSQKFICPGEGYFADPENCRWFFACRDYARDGSTFTQFEFRCPFGLVFDEQNLLCNWPWLVPQCSAGQKVAAASYVVGQTTEHLQKLPLSKPAVPIGSPGYLAGKLVTGEGLYKDPRLAHHSESIASAGCLDCHSPTMNVREPVAIETPYSPQAPQQQSIAIPAKAVVGGSNPVRVVTGSPDYSSYSPYTTPIPYANNDKPYGSEKQETGRPSYGQSNSGQTYSPPDEQYSNSYKPYNGNEGKNEPYGVESHRNVPPKNQPSESYKRPEVPSYYDDAPAVKPSEYYKPQSQGYKPEVGSLPTPPQYSQEWKNTEKDSQGTYGAQANYGNAPVQHKPQTSSYQHGSSAPQTVSYAQHDGRYGPAAPGLLPSDGTAPVLLQEPPTLLSYREPYAPPAVSYDRKPESSESYGSAGAHEASRYDRPSASEKPRPYAYQEERNVPLTPPQIREPVPYTSQSGPGSFKTEQNRYLPSDIPPCVLAAQQEASNEKYNRPDYPKPHQGYNDKQQSEHYKTTPIIGQEEVRVPPAYSSTLDGEYNSGERRPYIEATNGYNPPKLHTSQSNGYQHEPQYQQPAGPYGGSSGASVNAEKSRDDIRGNYHSDSYQHLPREPSQNGFSGPLHTTYVDQKKQVEEYKTPSKPEVAVYYEVPERVVPRPYEGSYKSEEASKLALDEEVAIYYQIQTPPASVSSSYPQGTANYGDHASADGALTGSVKYDNRPSGEWKGKENAGQSKPLGGASYYEPPSSSPNQPIKPEDKPSWDEPTLNAYGDQSSSLTPAKPVPSMWSSTGALGAGGKTSPQKTSEQKAYAAPSGSYGPSSSKVSEGSRTKPAASYDSSASYDESSYKAESPKDSNKSKGSSAAYVATTGSQYAEAGENGKSRITESYGRPGAQGYAGSQPTKGKGYSGSDNRSKSSYSSSPAKSSSSAAPVRNSGVRQEQDISVHSQPSGDGANYGDKIVIVKVPSAAKPALLDKWSKTSTAVSSTDYSSVTTDDYSPAIDSSAPSATRGNSMGGNPRVKGKKAPRPSQPSKDYLEEKQQSNVQNPTSYSSSTATKQTQNATYDKPSKSASSAGYSDDHTGRTSQSTSGSNYGQRYLEKIPVNQSSAKNESLGPEVCVRAGLFRHPMDCQKFYECYWDRWIHQFTVHIFKCPVQLVYDEYITACNWPFDGPACVPHEIIKLYKQPTA